MLTDIRYSIRALRGAPAFTLVAVSTLALGIAVNTIAFTLLNSLALRPMPVRDADRIVRIYPVDINGRRRNLFSYPDYLSYRDQLTSFDQVVAYIPEEVTLGLGGGDPEPQPGLAYAVSANHFPTLGIEPSLGRGFTTEEEQSTSSGRVAVISYAMWERRYSGATDVVGRPVNVNGRPFTIVGVGPRQFVGTEPLAPDVWVPLSAQPILRGRDALNDRNEAWLLVLGRLGAGGSRGSAEQEVSVVAARLSASFPAPDRPVRATIAPGTFFPLERELTPVVVLVMATIGLVLIIACANIANLSLARAAAMRRQVAVRLALGAGRWRIVRYQITESVIVALLGGSAALLLSAWTLRLLYPIGMPLLPESWASVVLDLTPDVRVFLYTLLLSLVAAVSFGLVPALQTSSPQISSALREDGTVLGTRVARSAIRDGLVVLQIAVCLMLLAAAALTARSVQRTRALDLGFRTSGVVYTRADLRRYGYTPAAVADFYRRLNDRVRALPDVTAVAWTTHVPLTGGVRRAPVRPEGHDSDTVTNYTEVSAGYFEALGVPILEGRAFTAEESKGGAPVAIISDALARRFWPNTQGSSEGRARVLGRRITTPRAPYPLTIVGVAKDAANTSLWRDKEVSIYVPADTTKGTVPLELLVRTSGDVNVLAAQLREAARASDPGIFVEVRPLSEIHRFWAVPARAAAIAAAVLGALALIMSAIGIYGVITNSVSQRTREIGIRIALGAGARDVVRLVMIGGAKLITLGIVFGLAGALATTRFLKALLDIIDPLDPLAFAAATTFLAAVAFAACYRPVRRAARVDPMVALRES
jgi:predicted permease